jgi:hypothetical protein
VTATTTRGYTYYVGTDPADLAAATAALAASIDTDVTNAVTPLIVSTFGDIGSAYLPSHYVTVGAANTILAARIRVKTEFTPTQLLWFSVTQSGNYDIGIINWATRARLWSKGSTAWPAAGKITEPINGGAGITLSPGTDYGLCFAFDNNTAELLGLIMEYADMATAADNTVTTSIATATFPIPATMPAHTATDLVPHLMLVAP